MNCDNNKNQELRIVRGNAFNIRINVEAIRLDGSKVENFKLGEASPELKIWHAGEKTPKEFLIEDNNVIISFDGTEPLGWYGVEMTGTFESAPWRFAVVQVFQIVETNEKANVPSWSILTDQTYFIEGVLTLYASGANYQADWNEKDTTSPSYIKNKPDLSIYATKTQLHSTEQQLQHNIDMEETRAKAAEKQNADDIDALESRMGTAEDDIEAIESKIPAAASDQNKLVDKQQMDNATANFITRSVNDLVNYYLKSDTYTKAEVQQLIAAVKQFTYEVVDELPTASASTMNKIYLVPSTNPKTENVKDEFITIATDDGGTISYSWEQIGTTTVDLSGYYTSAQTDQAISNALSSALAAYSTTEQMNSAIGNAINTALASYSTTEQMNSAITNALNTALAAYSTTTQMESAIATALITYYTKTEVDALIANFITKNVNDLVNYYLKSDTYTKAEVQQLIAAVKQFTYEVVNTLPTASADTMHKIYLVPSTNPQTENVKDEYITIATDNGGTITYSWEQIGTTTVDLSGYYTSAQTDQAISNALSAALAAYSTTEQMNSAITTALNNALAAYSTTTQMNAAIAAALTPYYTKEEIDALLADKADKDGNYPDLVAGNVVGEFNQEAKFMFRPSAGNVSSEDKPKVSYGGNIDEVRGNTVKVVQTLNKPLDASSSYFYVNDASLTYSNGIFTFLAASSTNNVNMYPKKGIDGHKYYYSAIVKATNENTPIGLLYDQFSVGTTWKKISAVSTATYIVIRDYRSSGFDNIYFKDELMALDLTLMGIDSLTTVEEVEAWLTNHIGNIDYIPYTPGKLVNYGGYAVKWNQLCKDKEEYEYLFGMSFGTTIPQGHKIYLASNVKKSTDFTSSNMSISLANGTDTYGGSISYSESPADGQYHKVSGIITNNNSLNNNLYYFQTNKTGTVTFKESMVIDLTLMFGEGNEPDLDWCNKWLSRDYYPYCPSVDRNILDVMEEKSVVDGVAQYKTLPTGIKTVGFNQWDEEQMSTWYEITKTVDGWQGDCARFLKTYWVNNLGYDGQICVYMKATAESGGSNFRLEFHYTDGTKSLAPVLGDASVDSYELSTSGKTVSYIDANYGNPRVITIEKLCINLSDPSRNGTYEPYWSSFSDMSWITKIGIPNFNVWDEEWELGDYYFDTGLEKESSTQIRTKNFNPCIPNTQYYGSNKTLLGEDYGWMSLLFYDSNKNYLGYVAANNKEFTTPQNAKYFKLACASDYGNTYNHDICINVSIPHFNGRYYPYGMTAPYFPNGMCHDEDIYDEVKVVNGKIKGVVRFGDIDLGNLGWTTEAIPSGYRLVSSVVIGCKPPQTTTELSHAMCSKYIIVTPNDSYYGAVGLSIDTDSSLRVFDTNYNTASPENFKKDIIGTHLVFELETPYEFEIDQELLMPYKADAYGTEEILPVNDSSIITAAPLLNLRYGINAGDTIKNLPFRYLSPKMQQSFTELEKRQARKNIGVDATRADVLALIRANEDALLTALKTAGTITDYTLDADADANGVFSVTVS